MTLQSALVTPEIVDQILQLGQCENEVCGIVTPDGKVVHLPNVSPEPRRRYRLDEEDLVNALVEYADRSGVLLRDLRREHFIIWHTHPNGEVGPSMVDMRQKVEGFRYLVVAIPSGVASIF